VMMTPCVDPAVLPELEPLEEDDPLDGVLPELLAPLPDEPPPPHAARVIAAQPATSSVLRAGTGNSDRVLKVISGFLPG
jgi:hypothetical protein